MDGNLRYGGDRLRIVFLFPVNYLTGNGVNGILISIFPAAKFHLVDRFSLFPVNFGAVKNHLFHGQTGVGQGDGLGLRSRQQLLLRLGRCFRLHRLFRLETRFRYFRRFIVCIQSKRRICCDGCVCVCALAAGQ